MYHYLCLPLTPSWKLKHPNGDARRPSGKFGHELSVTEHVATRAGDADADRAGEAGGANRARLCSDDRVDDSAARNAACSRLGSPVLASGAYVC
jgi:hypothetical protein